MAKNRAKLTRRKTLAAKVETTTGTEVTLANTDYLEAFNPKIDFDDTFNKRAGVGLGNRRGVPGAQSGTTSFDTELRNSGTVTLPLTAALLTAAGFKNTGGVFSLQTAADIGDTASVGLYADGRFKSLAGVMFDLKLAGEVGKPVIVSWSGKGKRSTGASGPRDITAIAITPMSGTPPVVKGITLTIGAVSYCFSKFELDLGNDVQLRPCATDATGFLAAQIVGRAPTFTIDPEQGTLTAKNFYADYEAGTEVALSITIGSGTNSTVTIAATNLQLMKAPEDQDGAGIARDGLSFQINETAGDDELTITFA